ncbi:hypothetical protein [Streptomyces sp. NPDC008150]|uniref:hypothetical protein n=1 Tax=Streptomyces sp. NPDC008150 TaxID=3364816 RepID=UPI0036ED2EAA
MSDNTTSNSGDGPGARVFNFPRIGFRPAATQAPNTTPAPAPAPATAPASDPATLTLPAQRVRRSPLDTIAALPDLGITQPLTTTPGSLQPGHVPAAFRNEPAPDHGQMAGRRLGALSLAAVLAVAVAALNGTARTLQDRRQRRLAQDAENAPLRKARLKQQAALAAGSTPPGKNRRVPSSTEWGSKTVSKNRKPSTGSGPGSKSTGTPAAKKPAPSKPASRSSGKPGASHTSRTTSSGRKNTGPKTTSAKKQQPKSQDASRRHSKGSPNTPAGKGGKGGKQPSTARTALDRIRNRKNPHPAPKPGKAPSVPRTVKDKARDARIKAKAARKEKVRADRFNTKQKARKTARLEKEQQKKARNGHTLSQATVKEARRRLKKRRKNLQPPVLSKAARKPKQKPAPSGQNTKPASGPAAGKNTGTAKPSGPNGTPGAAKTSTGATPKTPPTGSTKTNGTKTNGGKTGKHSRWSKARAYARRNAGTTGPNPASTTPGGNNTAGSSGTSGTTGPAAGNTPNPGPGPGPGTGAGSRQRRSPFQNAGQATSGGYTVTITRDDQPTPGHSSAAIPTRRPALGPAPVPHTARPGTTRIQEARTMAAHVAQQHTGRHMDAQHATEITLDDALDEYGDFTADAFATNAQSHKLAGRARKLRDVLADFAEDLAINHNLIGPLFSAAMARMSESMDLVARMADEMETASLQAAEQAESADNDLNDAYRPYNTATADAGLSTPSAPIHNEG